MTKKKFNYFLKVHSKEKYKKNDVEYTFYTIKEVIKAIKDQLLELIASP
jgi:hypothetical protein